MSHRVRQQVEKAILFIEAHLDERLTALQVAEHAHVSEFHFQRLFSAYMGETLSQYILHRRLELAAAKIVMHSSMGVAEIAVKSGFETHSAFSRAFKKHFGITPKAFRANPISAKLSRDKSRPFLNTVAPKHKNIEVSLNEYPALWLNHKSVEGSIYGDENQGRLLNLNRDMKALLSTDRPNLFSLAVSCSSVYSARPQRATENASSMIYGGIYSEKHDDAWSDDWFEIDAGLWAVCTHEGSNDHTYQTWNKLLRGWLPESGYELRDTIHFSHFINSSEIAEKPDKLLKKVYLPIKKAETEQLHV